MARVRNILSLLRDTWVSFQRDGGPLLGGAVAFFAILSATPIVVVAVAIAGAVFGEEAARGELRWQIRATVGREAGDVLLGLLSASYDPKAGAFASLVSLAVLFYGASRVFVMLRLGLNLIWGVRVKPQQRLKKAAATLARKRLVSLGMVVLCGVLLLVVLSVKTGVSAIDKWLGEGIQIGWAFRGIETTLSFAVLTVLFASMYKVLPDVRIAWRDVWFGALLTSALMSVGIFLIGLYLGNLGPSSTYGAAGSLVLVLFWVYYSGQIFFLGAAFTEVYARRFGRGVTPEPHAERLALPPQDEENAPPWLSGKSNNY